MSVTATYRIQGMTCEHCTRAVTDAVAELPEVSGVEVHLSSATAVVISDAQLSETLVEAAVAEAGYTATRLDPGHPR